MEKEYIAGEPQRYEIGGRVFIVEPRYRKDGESMADIGSLLFKNTRLLEKIKAKVKSQIIHLHLFRIRELVFYLLMLLRFLPRLELDLNLYGHL